MTVTKSYHTHKVTFAANSTDDQGHSKLGPPVDVGSVWARRGDKKGGILSWDISPGTLGDGQFRLKKNRVGNREPINETPMAHMISFSEKRNELNNGSKLGRPVTVANVQENGVINWSISPARLKEGVFFVLENERQHQQYKAKGDKLDQLTHHVTRQPQNGLTR